MVFYSCFIHMIFSCIFLKITILIQGFSIFLRDQFFCLLSMVILLILVFSNCLVIFNVYLYLYQRTSVSALSHLLRPAFGNSGREMGHAAAKSLVFWVRGLSSYLRYSPVPPAQEPTFTALVSKKATLLSTACHKLVRQGVNQSGA